MLQEHRNIIRFFFYIRTKRVYISNLKTIKVYKTYILYNRLSGNKISVEYNQVRAIIICIIIIV